MGAPIIALEHVTTETECSNNKHSLGLFRVPQWRDFLYLNQNYESTVVPRSLYARVFASFTDVDTWAFYLFKKGGAYANGRTNSTTHERSGGCR